jgi:hypothetical protein
MTSPALTEVTDDLVSALRRVLTILEAEGATGAGTSAVPAPREPVADEDLGTSIRRVLDADAVHSVLRAEVLNDASPEVSARVLAKVDALRLDLIAQVETIPMEDELHWTLALSYMELKAQWLQRQVRTCYEEMITGTCNREVALEASAVSYLIGLVEPLLNQENLLRIQELFVSQAVD